MSAGLRLEAAYEQQLRETFASACAAAGGTLKKILMVGAVLEKGALSENDYLHLDRSLGFLNRNDYPVSPDFEATIAELANGHDFLGNDEFEADVVMICHIPDMDEEDVKLANTVRASRMDPEVYSPLSVSPHYAEPNIWARAAQRAGAKIVVTCGKEAEIHFMHFRAGYHLMGVNYVSGFVYETMVAAKPVSVPA